MDENNKKMNENKEPSQERRINDIAYKPKELSILYSILWRNWRHLFPFFSSPRKFIRMDRKKKKIVMAKEMSIICIILSIDTKEKADLVFELNTHMSSKLEVIQALEKALKWNSDHEEIDVQRRNIEQLMEAANKISIELDRKKKEKNQMKSILRDRASASANTTVAQYSCEVPTVINCPPDPGNLLPELIGDDLKNLSLLNLGEYRTFDVVLQGQQKTFSELRSIEKFKILQIAYKTTIELIEYKREILMLRACASTVQHSAPLNGNDLMNQGTYLLQPNMNSGSNSDPVSDILLTAPPGSKDEGN